MKKTTLFATTAILASMLPTASLADQREFFYGPDFVLDATGRYFSQRNSILPDTTTINGFEVSCDADDNPTHSHLCPAGTQPFDELTSWSLGAFTGWQQNPRVVRSEFVVAGGNARYGDSGFQMAGTRVGMFVSSYYSSSWTDADTYSINMTYAWNANRRIRPWNAHGTGARLCLSETVSVPDSYVGGGSSNQTNASLLLRDLSTQREVFYEMIHYASFSFPEDVGVDQHPQGTGIPIVIAKFAANSRFVTLVPTSSTTRSSTWTANTFFGGCITSANLATAISELNAKTPVGTPLFSTNVANYEVEALIVEPEVYAPAGTDGHMSVVFDSVSGYVDFP